MDVRETPSSVMYADLKAFGHIKNADLASILMRPDARLGGDVIANRIQVRSFLSREIVRAEPGALPAGCFADLASSSLTVYARLRSGASGRAGLSPDEIRSHYLGPAASAMREALAACGLDDRLYANALGAFRSARVPDGRDKGALYLMLFIAAGCSGNVPAAVGVVERFAAGKLAASLRTVETGFEPGAEVLGGGGAGEAEGRVLALMRVVDGVPSAVVHRLSTAPEGSVIGILATGERDVTDVAPDVSRRHLRIWREGGTWLAQGLGSTNGTAIISGATGALTVIEPPRAQRVAGAVYPPVPLADNDVLCLGATTRFLVMTVLATSD